LKSKNKIWSKSGKSTNVKFYALEIWTNDLKVFETEEILLIDQAIFVKCSLLASIPIKFTFFPLA